MLFLLNETHALGAHALGNHLFQTDERAAADKQDVGGVNRREFLMGMLAATLRRNVGNRTFQDLEQRLLHALARDIAGDGRILVLAADLIDLVDVDDALLAALHIPIGVLQQPQDDILDVLADVAGFGSVVASTMANGTSRMRARVCASSVLPVPVGPIRRMLDFDSSTSAPRCLFIWMRL